MPTKISPSKESPATLMGKAADCLEIARAQHETADQQHLHANKLEKLAHTLELSAIELNGKMLLDARPAPLLPGATPRKLAR